MRVTLFALLLASVESRADWKELLPTDGDAESSHAFGRFKECSQKIYGELPGEERAEERAAALKAWREKWLDRLILASTTDKTDERDQIVIQCIGLANALGRSKLSRQLCEDLIGNTESKYVTALLRNEISEIDAAAAQSSGSKEDSERAIASLNEVIQSEGQGGKPEWRIRAFAKKADIQVKMGDSDSSIATYEAGLAALKALTPSERQDLAGYDEAFFLSQQLHVVCEFDPTRAEDILLLLESTAVDFPVSQHVLLAVRVMSQTDAAAARKLALSYIDRHPKDSSIPELLHEVARTYVAESDLQQARLTWEKLLKLYEADLIQSEASSLTNGQGGLLSVVYFDLIETLRRLGETELAASMSARAMELFPNDEAVLGISQSTSKIGQASAVTSRAKAKDVTTVSWFIVGNVILIIGCLSVWMFAKRRSGK